MSPKRGSSFNTIDLEHTSIEEAYHLLSQAAKTSGVVLVTNLSTRPPVEAIQSLLLHLDEKPALTSGLNDTHHERKVHQADQIEPTLSSQFVQWTRVGLSVRYLQSVAGSSLALVKKFGNDFKDIENFYKYVEDKVLPIVARATSKFAGSDLGPTHVYTDYLSLIGYLYYPEPSSPRLKGHCAWNTHTIIFHDGAAGSLEIKTGGDDWEVVPANVGAIISWHRHGAAPANNARATAKQSVRSTWPTVEQRKPTLVLVGCEDTSTNGLSMTHEGEL